MDQLRSDLLTMSDLIKDLMFTLQSQYLALTVLLIDKGVITDDELGQAQARIQPEFDQMVEQRLDELKCANMTMREIVDEIRRTR